MPTFVAILLTMLIFLGFTEYSIIGIWLYWLISLLF
jgi:hypothetical protein